VLEVQPPEDGKVDVIGVLMDAVVIDPAGGVDVGDAEDDKDDDLGELVTELGDGDEDDDELKLEHRHRTATSAR
jgi:hypothetical protein